MLSVAIFSFLGIYTSNFNEATFGEVIINHLFMLSVYLAIYHSRSTLPSWFPYSLTTTYCPIVSLLSTGSLAFCCLYLHMPMQHLGGAWIRCERENHYSIMGQTVFYGMNSVVTNSIISILWFSNYQYSFHIKTLVLYVGLALRLFLFFSFLFFSFLFLYRPRNCSSLPVCDFNPRAERDCGLRFSLTHGGVGVCSDVSLISLVRR